MSSRAPGSPQAGPVTLLIPAPAGLTTAAAAGKTVVQLVAEQRAARTVSPSTSAAAEAARRLADDQQDTIVGLRHAIAAQALLLCTLREQIARLSADAEAHRSILTALGLAGPHVRETIFRDTKTLRTVVDMELRDSDLWKDGCHASGSNFLEVATPMEVAERAHEIGHELTSAQWILMGRVSIGYQDIDSILMCIRMGRVILDFENECLDAADMQRIARAYEAIGAQEAADDIWEALP